MSTSGQDYIENFKLRLKSRLGFPIVDLYTTDEMIELILQDTIIKFSKYAPSNLRVANCCVDGARRVCLPEGVSSSKVLNVYPITPSQNPDLVLQDVFGRLYWDYEFYWNYAGEHIYVSTLRNSVVVEYIDGTQDISTFPDNIKELSYKYSLALLKQSEGRIRGKHHIDGNPFNNDAESLLAEAKDELAEVEQLIATLIPYKGATNYRL